MTRIALVRHGQSEWNALGRWQGQADPPLTDLGRQQAIAAAARVGAVDAIASSTLQRASDTALLISNQIGVGPVGVLPELMERRAGEWEGLTRVEIEERYAGYLDNGTRPPGWEDDDALADRAVAALEALDGQFPQADILAVTHAGLLYAVADRIGTPIRHGRISNLGGIQIERVGATWRFVDVVDLLDEDIRTSPEQI